MIRCADYRETLAGLGADLVLTDPPYGISRSTGFSNTKVDTTEFGEWDRPILPAELAGALKSALASSGTAVVWWNIWRVGELREALEAAGFRMCQAVFWEKTNPVPLNSKRTYLPNARESAVVAAAGPNPFFAEEHHSGVFRAPIPRTRYHPTQKPVEIFEQLIETHCPPRGLVADPFLGGGTTAVAAVRRKRRFAGGDVSPDYVETAQKRVAGEVAQRRIF